MQDGTAGLGSYPDLLKDMLSSDVNVAIVASKNLLSVAESTQVTRQSDGITVLKIAAMLVFDLAP